MTVTLRIEVFTLFPEVFEPYLNTSIILRARQRKLLSVGLHNIRDWASDRHHVTDDVPYGGGGGMIMKPEPIFAAVESIVGFPPECDVILMTPQGRLLTQRTVKELVKDKAEQSHSVRYALICGRYEGIDERVRKYLATDEISVGDYVLSGGELASLILIDAMTRILPGVLGDPKGADEDSFASGLLEYPHYTRPTQFREWHVPEVLLSGDHKKINQWRREKALYRTWNRRPDLLARANLTRADREYLKQLDNKSTG